MAVHGPILARVAHAGNNYVFMRTATHAQGHTKLATDNDLALASQVRIVLINVPRHKLRFDNCTISIVTTHTGEHHPHRKGMARKSREVEYRFTPTHIELVRDDEFGLPEPTFRDRVGNLAKRLIDVMGALIGLVLSLPIFVIVGLAIKLDSKGPIFFAHRRLGRDGRHFDCLKFRTMHVDAERRVFENEDLRHQYVSNHFKIPGHLDPRITALGQFLRKSSLDELPQLLNVLIGDMSLVGPRPIVALEATHYGDRLNLLLSVRPGLTGLWAVNGRSELGYPERADVELSYVRERSLAADLRILALTPWIVVTQRGTI